MRPEDYEILYDRDAGEYAPAEVGGTRTRTIRSGAMVEVECFPIVRVGESAERERQRRRSTPAQAALNRKKSFRRCMRMIEANFTPRSLVLTLTYDYGLAKQRGLMNHDELLSAWARDGLPMESRDVRRHYKRWLEKIRRRMPEPGLLKYLYVIETTHEPLDTDPRPLPAHYHIHLVIDAPGVERDTLEKLWGHGFVESSRLRLKDGGAARIARYLTKREGKGGGQVRRAQRWACSQNLRRPTVTVSDRKVSRRRAARIAADVLRDGARILEALYPGCRCEEPPEVKYSDFVAGAYIYARMRRME